MATAQTVSPSTTDSRERVLAAVKKVSTIATLPEVTAKIVATVEDPKSSAAQLHRIVAHDPALVTRILKVVNSSFYGLPGQIGSIERAIVLLGLNAVKNIAVAASLGQMFRGVSLCEGFTARDLWSHCIGVAVIARELAMQSKLPIADEAFLAGMIHDVGMLVSLQIQPEKLREVCDHVRRTDADFCATERDFMGMDHQQLGEALAEMWRFPKSCQQVAAHHHTVGTLASDHRKLISLIHIADAIACRHAPGFNLTAAKSDPLAEGCDLIEPAVIQQTIAKIPDLLSSASDLMG